MRSSLSRLGPDEASGAAPAHPLSDEGSLLVARILVACRIYTVKSAGEG